MAGPADRKGGGAVLEGAGQGSEAGGRREGARIDDGHVRNDDGDDGDDDDYKDGGDDDHHVLMTDDTVDGEGTDG